MRIFLAFVAALLIAGCAHAQSISSVHSAHSVASSGPPPPPPTTCVFGSAFPDGCAAANQNASFTVLSQYGESFQAYAIQDSQSWTSAHPQPFNVAGVDYPVGPDKGVVFCPTVGCKDWTTTTPPTGCAFSATGNPFNPLGGPWISCTGTGSNPTFDGWDFSTSGGGVIRISANVGTLTIKNSYFKKGKNSNCTACWHFASNGSPSSVLVKNNLFDGNNQSCRLTASYTATTLTITGVVDCDPNASFNPGQLVMGGSLTHTSSVTVKFTSQCNLLGGVASCAISNNTGVGGPDTITVADADWNGIWDWTGIGDGSGTNCIETIEYNAFINQPWALGTQLGGGCFITFAYNFDGSIGLNPVSVAHTAFSGTAPLANGQVGLLAYLYNTMIIPAASNGHGTTSFSFLGSTGLYTGYVNGQMIGNTTVTNLIAGGLNSTSQALLDILDISAFTGTLELHDNWVSPHGGLSCLANSGDWGGNYFVDDGLGGGSYDGVAGNVITVTTTYRGAVYVGSTIGSNTVPYGPVSPYGTPIPGTSTPTTGTGKNAGGSYVFTGTARAVAPTSPPSPGAGKTWDSPITGTLITGPGLSVGTNLMNGEQINIAGVQWANGNCTRTP